MDCSTEAERTEESLCGRGGRWLQDFKGKDAITQQRRGKNVNLAREFKNFSDEWKNVS
jgi:hypothetical protein